MPFASGILSYERSTLFKTADSRPCCELLEVFPCFAESRRILDLFPCLLQGFVLAAVDGLFDCRFSLKAGVSGDFSQSRLSSRVFSTDHSELSVGVKKVASLAVTPKASGLALAKKEAMEKP